MAIHQTTAGQAKSVINGQTDINGVVYCPKATFIEKNDVLIFCGPLFQDAVEQLMQRKPILNRTHKIRITSQGGYTSDATAFLNIIKETHTTVELDKYCLSACAMVIFIASPELVVRKNTFVAFHHTISYLADLREKNKNLLGPPDNIQLRERNAEKELFLSKKIPYETLLAISYNMGYKCAKREGNKILIESKANLTIPTRQQAESLRGKFIGYWPKDALEISNKIITHKAPFKNGDIIKFGMDFKNYTMVGSCNEN